MCLKPHGFGSQISAQMHHFSDASELGYGTASYIRFLNKNGDVHCRLILAKSRVAPLKIATIPRMELTAAAVAVRVDAMLRRELQMPVIESRFWTDSTTVLSYIKSDTARFHTFVANRVDLIREASAPSQWGHVRTACNPADVCSRGTSVKAFLDSEKWIKGPKFLWRDESEWYEKDIGQFTLKNTDPELKCVLATEVKPVDPLSRAIERCSSWSKLKGPLPGSWWECKTCKCVLLFAREDYQKGRLPEGQKQHGNLSVQDMRRAEEALVRFVQKEHWPNDIASLHKKSSSLRRLDPVIKNKLLCVGGRLQRANIDVMSKHQVLLPRNSHVSRLILRDIHETNGHLGKNHILAKLRQQYWIVGTPSLIKQITSKCVVCRRYQPSVGQRRWQICL
ncbi:uncharacterized protein LOC117108202 [Anneissia japonica]|uniref:uncharacterized protein LOC117108202 n=1 Tax=Anneissia japonica TaxID=1529436 RepID=UPI0014259AF8|nr:uncharacterized protein LOC117108202 [Anneissia japonica]